MRELFTIIFALVLLSQLNAQPSFNMGMRAAGYTFTSPSTETYGGATYEEWVKTATTDENDYLVHADNFFNKWQNNSTPFNSQFTLFFGNSASPDGLFSTVPSNGNTYVFRLRREDGTNNGYTDLEAIMMELTAAPVTINSVTQSPAAVSGFVPNQDIEVTVNLSGTVSSENIIIRYSTDNFATYGTLLSPSADANTASPKFTIPTPGDGNSVQYYVLTTTLSTGDISGSSFLTDLATIELDNNGSNYSYTVDAALPVEITSFTATPEPKRVDLSWTTSSEESNAGFDVQKSVDGKNFETIGTVEGNGTSVEVNTYNFIDESPVSGVNYYRLKQNDFDGAFEYSDILTVKFDAKATATIFPNPTSEKLVLATNTQEEVNIRIFNLNGQLVYQNSKRVDNQLEINLNELANGNYILQVTNAVSQAVIYNGNFVKH